MCHRTEACALDALAGPADAGSQNRKVGLLLSTGLDAAVLAAAVRRQGIRPPCFSVSVDDDGATAATAKALGLPHRPLVLQAEDLLAAESLLIGQLDAPMGHPGSRRLAQWLLYRFAAEQVDTVLSGQGADDLLGGHRRHRAEALRHRLPDPARGSLRRAADLLASTGERQLGHARRALKVLAQDDWLTAYVDARDVFRVDEITSFGAGPCPEPSRLFAPWLRELNRIGGAHSDLHRSLWLDTRTRLADDLLVQDERLATLHGLDLQQPFLAAPLLAFIEGSHDDWRVTPRESWRVLRAHARRVLPESIARRRRPASRLPNLFKLPRFQQDSQQRVATYLGTGLGWQVDRLVAVIRRGTRGGIAERQAWTLHALARWLETVQTTEAHTATMVSRDHGQGVDADMTS